MEWVETTAKTVDEAKDLALDRLGVDAVEAEFQVLEEPKAGLFGRMRGEARVRARVAPRTPRPKQERRDRRRSSDKSRGSSAAADEPVASEGDGDEPKPAARKAAAKKAPAKKAAAKKDAPAKRAAAKKAAAKTAEASDDGAPDEVDSSDDVSAQDAPTPKSNPRSRGKKEEATVTTTLAEQTEMADEFLTGLLEAFDVSGELVHIDVDEETAEIDIQGEDLGLLIGQRGQTIAAVQELTRTVLQRRAGGSYEGRVRVDVSGYRQRRREALIRFTTQVAEQARESGAKKALEPMNAADRKVVHDTVNDIDGVSTSSEGEEPRRWVVIHPED